MHSETDVARIVRSWLRTDEHESADRVLDDVLALLDATPQRRPAWSARRIADMNTYARLLVAAVAVAIVAVIGINLLPASGGVGTGPPAVSPSPSLAATPAPIPSPSPAAIFPPAGPLANGQHAMTLEDIPFTFSVGKPGWVSNGSFGIDKAAGIGPEGAGFIFWGDTPTGVYADPCAGVEGPAIGPSPAKLAAAVASLPGTDLVSGPTDVTVGGRPAKQVVISIPENVGCTAESFNLWYAPRPDLARYATRLGSTIRVWIIDVDGTPVWIDGETYKGAGPAPAQDIQEIVDSIQFE